MVRRRVLLPVIRHFNSEITARVYRIVPMLIKFFLLRLLPHLYGMDVKADPALTEIHSVCPFAFPSGQPGPIRLLIAARFDLRELPARTVQKCLRVLPVQGIAAPVGITVSPFDLLQYHIQRQGNPIGRPRRISVIIVILYRIQIGGQRSQIDHRALQIDNIDCR